MQRELRETPGVTVLIYDQTCAAEKRRRRKRGTLPRSAEARLHQRAGLRRLRRLLARSRTASRSSRSRPSSAASARIDQSTCNKDYLLRRTASARASSPWMAARCANAPGDSRRRPTSRRCRRRRCRRSTEPYDILVTGIGGTGVVTIGALLGMAAHLEGKGCSVLDMTGLAQKDGAVMSHVRIADAPERYPCRAHRRRRRAICCSAATSSWPRAPDGAVAASQTRRHPRRRQHALRPSPAAFTRNRRPRLPAGRRWSSAIARRRRPRRARDFVDAHAACHRADGRFDRHQSLHAGLCLSEGPGPARRRGDRARDRAERRRRRDATSAPSPGAACAARRSRRGRAHAAAPSAKRRSQRLSQYARRDRSPAASRSSPTIRTPPTPQRYRDLVAARAQPPSSRSAPGRTRRSPRRWRATYFKLMAYKDEYEVARLYTDGEFVEALAPAVRGRFQARVPPRAAAPRRRDPDDRRAEEAAATAPG